jgi:hypothetical protein
MGVGYGEKQRFWRRVWPAPSAGERLLLGKTRVGRAQEAENPERPLKALTAVSEEIPRGKHASGSLMYEPHFGLREKPFSILPDPDLI